MTPEQKQRYLRHILLLGADAQERLLAATVAVDEAEGAGAAALVYLAAAGVGTLVVPDARPVAPADVGLLFETADIGQTRSAAAAARLPAHNPDVRVVTEGDAAHRVTAVPVRDDADAVARGAAAAAAVILAITA